MSIQGDLEKIVDDFKARGLSIEAFPQCYFETLQGLMVALQAHVVEKSGAAFSADLLEALSMESLVVSREEVSDQAGKVLHSALVRRFEIK